MEQLANEPQRNVLPFKFTGNALEYFSIWIVNVGLTIVTLGIYSAWAKVRTQRYFYSNTVLGNATFQYLANPLQILKGRIIAFVVFMIYYAATLWSPLATLIIVAILMLLTPALMVLAMSFKLRNSAYRHVTFYFNKRFIGAYQLLAGPLLLISAYIIFVALNLFDQFGQDQPSIDPAVAVTENMLLVGVSIGFVIVLALLLPWWEFLITRFRVAHSHYGSAALTFHAMTGDYYKMYLIAFFSVFALGTAIIVLIPLAAVAVVAMTSMDQSIVAGIIAPLLIGIFLLPVYLWFWAYLQTTRTNLIFNHIQMAEHQLQCGLKTRYIMYLYLTNTLMILLTFGLMIPWAKIRTARYRASVTSLAVMGDLDQFVALQHEKQTALGEEMGEMFDFDMNI